MKNLWISIGLLLAYGPVLAQSQECGTDLSVLSEIELQQALAFYRQAEAPSARGNTIDSVAITIHIVESPSSDSETLTISDLESELTKANNVFAQAGIYFFICGSPRYLDGDPYYDYTSGGYLNSGSYINNTINVYFANDVRGSQGQSVCGFAQLPFIGFKEDRYIMIKKSCATDGATLIHELGHFYGLLHTHDTSFGREFVDGSNCDSSGDLICDTSADPDLFTPGLMSGCTYVGRVRDPKGDLYTPPVSNFMSYAPSNCVRHFTGDQTGVMESVRDNENAYLTGRCDFYPDFGVSAETATLKIRSDQTIDVDFSFDLIGLDQAYDVELKISLATDPDETGLLLLKERVLLQPGENKFSRSFHLDFPISQSTGTYYLQAIIDSDNEVIERTEKNNLATTLITVDNSSLEDLLVFPNPANDELKLFIRDPLITGSLNIRIFRYDGRLVWETEGYKNQGEYFQLLDISDLDFGLYLITVDFEKIEAAYTLKFLKK